MLSAEGCVSCVFCSWAVGATCDDSGAAWGDFVAMLGYVWAILWQLCWVLWPLWESLEGDVGASHFFDFNVVLFQHQIVIVF